MTHATGPLHIFKVLIRQAVTKAPELLRYEHNAWKRLVTTTHTKKHQDSNLQFRQLLDTDRKNTNRPYVFKNK